MFAATTPPIHARGNFSLIGLSESIRLEVLVSLQTEDRAGYMIDPQGMVRLLPVLALAKSSLLEPGFEAEMMGFDRAKNTSRAAMVRRMFVTLKYLRDQFEGVDPTAGDLWDSYLTELPTERQRRDKYVQTNGEQKWLSKRHLVDFTPIRQVWLRELAKTWAREIRPDVTRVRLAIIGFSVLSDAIAERADGVDPSTAGALDIQRAMALLVRLKSKSGERYSSGRQSVILTALRRALRYLWGAGHMQGVSPGFVVDPEEGIARTKTPRTVMALPNRVVVALVDAIPKLPLASGQLGSLINAETLLHMHKTALELLAETGRRPNEVCSLKVGCVVENAPDWGETSGGFTLTYDNHKAGREGRTVPIGADLARRVLEWEAHRQTLSLPDGFDEWLFPSPSAGRRDANGHLTTGGLKRALKRLVASVPWLDSDVPDKKTGGYVRFTGRLIPYSFRHSYAQRHADAGVGVEALAELMDHKSTSTTLNYFEVSEKRKREAAQTLAPLAMTRHGAPAPFDSAVAYEIAAVAVPFGGCVEPSNVKAGGTACPIRFQCAGCDMYRPDPSYLPAIETHVRSIRASLQMVRIAGTAAPWVIQNMVEEIAAYEKVIEEMNRRLAEFTDEERQAIADSSVAMRKLREQRPLIPLRVIR
ncbi:tyrosine-type recombinase/integrase [Microbacterium foliorum]|uniref:tyrosine-type recombinase/integrase n=1 Tax=Microbacterium foliorum TaxID=104336 RepID=UPI0015E385B6|nr:tyrosine-type recombinase/integrase [Microbacterium foliorum]